ncbi:hypothetical protein GCM10009682_18160 [Luedemannella flava]|uniref:Uncharacterized protein n=1 Tax=Luedemannella flava TaxID=349316 RepID=A0ABP4XW98_9ACTN
MTLVVVWIAPVAGPLTISATRLTELLNLHITAAHRVEHLAVRERFNEMAIFGFLMACSMYDARQTLTNLVGAVIASESELHYWRVV